jgi:polysaccharide deacetylase 2 family uncharacterized protein YibQ
MSSSFHQRAMKRSPPVPGSAEWRAALRGGPKRRLPIRLRWILLGMVVVAAAGGIVLAIDHSGEPGTDEEIAAERAEEMVSMPPPVPLPPARWPQIGQEPEPQAAPSAPAAIPPPAATVAIPPSQAAAVMPAKPSSPPPPIPPARVLLLPDGNQPWQRYAVAPRELAGRPAIAIVIDDMGLDRRRSARAAALPAPLTLSFLPYAEDLAEQTRNARARGHELLVHIPMEPLSRHFDAGPGALKVALSTEDLAERFRHDLSQFDSYVGINNHMGSRFTAYAPGMSVIMAELRDRGLLWLDSRTIANSVGMAEARQYGVPAIERDVFLDDVMTEAAVRKQLAVLKAIALKTGRAVAIGHPHDQTLNVLTSWLGEAAQEGFVMVPLSQLVRAQMPPEPVTPIVPAAGIATGPAEEGAAAPN